MARTASWLAAAAWGLLLDPAANAEIYRWTDPQGRVHFTQDLSQVPPEQRDAAPQTSDDASRFQTYAAPESAGPAPSRARSTGGFQIPFERHGQVLVVQVRLNDRVRAPFVVDTGASDVAVPSAVAERAGIRIGPETPRAVYQTANGAIASPIVTLDSVEAGEVRLEGVRAHVSEGLSVGLLGGAFFNQFTFQIDPAANSILLFPNDRIRSGLTEGQWRERFRAVRERLTALERYLADNYFARESRVAELEQHREELARTLESLEAEADAADVPHGWRD